MFTALLLVVNVICIWFNAGNIANDELPNWMRLLSVFGLCCSTIAVMLCIDTLIRALA